MVDKTIPYKNIIMIAHDPKPQNAVLPDGYYFDKYRDGDDETWAVMEQYAGDFATSEKALEYFRNTYVSRREELEKRFVIVRNKDGEGVCSCIAWNTSRNGERCPCLQWLVTAEGYEGLGLADAVAAETVTRFHDIGEKPVYLHTQPWSYKAVWLYFKHGFRISKNDTFQTFTNQCDEALPILESLIPKDKFEQITANLVD